MVADNLTRTAVEAAERGWAVFPCIPGTKRPAGPWVREDAWSADPAWVEADGWPGYNVGVALRHSGLVVLDLDRHDGGQDGVTAFNRLCSEHEPDRDWPDTLTVETPGRGYHLYFQNPDGLGNSRGTLPRGIDVKGAGGLVLAPGSVIDGRAYGVEHEAEIRPLPGWLLTLITTRREPRHARNPGGRWMPLYARRRQAEKLLDWLLGQREEGDRNNSLYWAARRLRELDLGEDAEAWLVAAGREIGLDEAEIAASVESGL